MMLPIAIAALAFTTTTPAPISGLPEKQYSLEEVLHKSMPAAKATYHGVMSKMHDLAARAKERVGEYRSGMTHFKAIFSLDGEVRRRMQKRLLNDNTAVLEAYLQNLGNLFDGSATSASDLFAKWQGFSCQGGSGEPGIVSALEGLLEEEVAPNLFPEGADIPRFDTPIASIFSCGCSSTWDLTTAGWVALYDAISNEGDIVNTIKLVVPELMSSAGLCSANCQATITALVDFVLAAAPELVEGGLSLPASAKSQFPAKTGGCICGAHVGWTTLVDSLFPSTSSVSTIDAVLSIFDDDQETDLWLLTDRFTQFFDFVFGPSFLCGGDCPDMIKHGTTLSLYAGTQILWPSAVEDWLKGAKAEDNPSEADIEAYSGNQVGCLCALNYNGIAQDLKGYITGTTPFPETLESWMDGAETVATAIFDGTAGKGRFCDTTTSYCPAMLSTGWTMFSGYIVALATEDFGPGDFQAVSPGVMTKSTLSGILSPVPGCFCGYFDPTNGGDLFAYAEKQILAISDAGSGIEQMSEADAISTAADVIIGAIRAGKLCKVDDCRTTFDKIFDLVNVMVDSAKVGTTNVCSASNTATCWSDSCFPFSSSASTSSCAVCYEVPKGTPQTYPMAHFDDDFDRVSFWLTCSMATECPAAGIEGYDVKMEMTFGDTTVEALQSKEPELKSGFIKMIDPQDKMGMTSSDVTVTYSTSRRRLDEAGQNVAVMFTLLVLNLAAKDLAEDVLGSLDATTASTAMATVGASVAAVGTPSVSTTSPSPTPAPAPSPGGSSTIAGTSTGGTKSNTDDSNAADPNTETTKPCFPSGATVTKADGRRTRLDALHEGDAIVATTAEGQLTIDTVSLLSIAKPEAEATFLVFTTEDRSTLTLTPAHHVPTGATCCSVLKQAYELGIGDTVWVLKDGAAASQTTIVTIRATLDHGLHSPVLTNGGFPVIDGVVTAFDSISGIAINAMLSKYVAPLAKAVGIVHLTRRLAFTGEAMYIDDVAPKNMPSVLNAFVPASA